METPTDADFVHRTAEDAEIYFVAAPEKGAQQGDCVFRVAGKNASFWDPTTGTVTQAPSAPTDDGRTSVSISLPENGSIFVVFSNDAAPTPYEQPKVASSFELSGHGR